MKAVKIIIYSVAMLLLSTVDVYGWSDWLTLRTEHFTVFYKPGSQDEAKRVLQTLEYYRPQVEKLCGNEARHLSVVIDDVGIMTNGITYPYNSWINLYRCPPGGVADAPIGTGATEDWWSLLGIHEYTHELMYTKTSGVPKILCHIFGNAPGQFPFNAIMWPNSMSPGWMGEGIAVYSESQITPYQGRLNEGLFDNYIAARVKDGRFISIMDATYNPLEYPNDASYLYGSEFINYLAKTYGEEKLTQFFAVNGGQLGNFLAIPAIGIDRSARKVFGKPFPQLWNDWRQYETERFNDFQYEGEQLSRRGWYISNLSLDAEKLYYQRFYTVKGDVDKTSQKTLNEIVERDLKTGLEKIIISTTTSFASAFRIRNGKLYYATTELKSGYGNALNRGFGYFALLHQYDLNTRKDRILLADEIRGYEVLPDGKILYSRDKKNGPGSELYQYIPESKEKKLLLVSEYQIHEIVGDGKRLIVNAQSNWESCNIYSLNLEKDEFAPLVQTPYTERWLSLSGDRLFFTANYQKKNSVYCYDFGSREISRVTQNGWVQYPTYDEETNKLYFAQQNSGGFDLYQKTADFQDFHLPDAQSTIPPTFTVDDSEITPGTYRDNLLTLVPRFWFPMIDSDKGEYGVMFGGGDAITDFLNYNAKIVYNTKKEKYRGEMDLPINFFAPLTAQVTYSDFEEKLKQLKLEYTFINRLSPGVSQLLAGTYVTDDKDYRGLEIKPYVTFGMQYPAMDATMTVSAPQSTLKNDRRRSGLYSNLDWKQYFSENEIHLNFQTINDPDNPHDDLFAKIRGYDDALTDNQGKIFTIEFTRPLFRIRHGLWNPNLYFGDVFGCIFQDQANPDNGEKQDSWGLELRSEVKCGFVGYLFGYRYVRTMNGDTRYEFFGRTSF